MGQEFRTIITPEQPGCRISIHDPVLLMGSCFSENIGLKLKDFKFSVLSNPFGVIYNPWSIFHLLQAALKKEKPGTDGLICNQGTYRHFDFHSAISATSRQEFIDKQEKAFDDCYEFLLTPGWLIVTFGTSYVYRLKKNNRIVSNCHKIPAKEFNKELMTVEEIISSFDQFYGEWKRIHPGGKILLTISPVRHLNDTLVKNNLSKSLLRVASERIAEQYKDTWYFPAYEIMMDDLRDYRFYQEDMIHPSDQAIEYLWNKFVQSFLEPATITFINNWSKVLKAMRHRPFYPGSGEHIKFLENLLSEVEKFNEVVDVRNERELLRRQITELKINI